MGRQLPSYDPDKDGPYDTSKRRREIFKRVYQNMERWRAQQEDYGMSPFMESPDGETIYYGDLMTGLPALAATAPQQLKAFERICLKEYTESAATAEILPDSKWSTPVQQYSDDALRKMIAAYDAVQDGTWDPVEAVKKKKRRTPHPKEEDPTVTSVETAPEVPEDVQEDQPLKSSRIAHLDWTTCSAENQRLAEYINKVAGVGITGQQVKALAFLRKPWYRSAEEQAIRKEEADRKEAEKAKYAYETDEQRAKRFEAARRLKAAEAAQEKARQAMEEVRQLRIEAGLDPETGEPASAV